MNSGGRIATEKLKLVQEKCQAILTAMLKDEDNKYCVDCDAKGPRWASWNLGVFLCIRCAGIHRNLGVHISKVKSVNLDTWKPEQAVSLQQMGNSRARAVYEANLPDNFRRPQTDSALEAFIRAKYEQNKYTAREWVPSRPPKVNWDAEIEAMTKDHKKSARSRVDSSATPVLVKPLPAPCSASTSATVKRKPKETSAPPVSAASPSAAADLLELDTPSPAASAAGAAATDPFGDFLSATPVSSPAPAATAAVAGDALAADEASFFSQSAADEAAGAGTKVMSRDSILALYGSPAGGGSGGGSPAGGGLTGFTSMPAVSSAAGYAGQQPMPGGFHSQQPVPAGFPGRSPAGFPPQQQPAGFPSQVQHQQMSTGFPPQQPQMAAGFAGQQGFGALYPVAGQQPHYVRQTPGYQSTPYQQQQPSLAGGGQTVGMASAPSSLPPLGHHQMHQQMAGLSLGAQQLPVGAVGGAAAGYPALSGGQAVNGQLWQ